MMSRTGRKYLVAGKLAVLLFQANGRMMHGFDEKIPSEKFEADNTIPAQARIRHISAVE